MKILLAVPWIPYPPTDGGRMRSYYLLREMSRRHQISLWCASNPGESRADLDSLSRLCQRLTVAPSGLNYSWMSKFRSAFGRSPFGAVALSQDTKQQLLEWGRAADLVHVQGMELMGYLRPLAAHRPVLFDMVDCNSLHMRQRAQWEHHPARRAWYALQARKLRSAEQAVLRLPLRILLSSCLDVKALLCGCGESTIQISVLANGADIGVDARCPPLNGGPRLVFTGNMAYGPNQDAVYYFCRKILPRIHRQRPEVRFEVLGKHPPAALVKWCRQFPSVAVLGFLPDLKTEMTQRTLYVCPLRIGTGIKLKVLEAMACGMAMVATPASVEGMPVEHGRHLLIAGSAQEFADQVLQALASPELRARLGAQALQLVKEHYAWSSIGSELDRIYQAAVRAPQ